MACMVPEEAVSFPKDSFSSSYIQIIFFIPNCLRKTVVSDCFNVNIS